MDNRIRAVPFVRTQLRPNRIEGSIKKGSSMKFRSDPAEVPEVFLGHIGCGPAEVHTGNRRDSKPIGFPNRISNNRAPRPIHQLSFGELAACVDGTLRDQLHELHLRGASPRLHRCDNTADETHMEAENRCNNRLR